jgi:NADH-quinone oxidoreductase subunit J
MLLDLKEEERRKFSRFGVATGVIAVGGLTVLVVHTLWTAQPVGAGPPQLEGGTVPLGHALFTQYLLPFEIVSVLLLVAMVGVILLSKKDLK